MKATITKISRDVIHLSDGSKIYSYHQQDCCENHYLDFSNEVNDGKDSDLLGMELDLSGIFFNKVPNYGIEFVSSDKRKFVRIPGYGSNNGYYGTDLTLVLEKNDGSKVGWNISECQLIN